MIDDVLYLPLSYGYTLMLVASLSERERETAPLPMMLLSGTTKEVTAVDFKPTEVTVMTLHQREKEVRDGLGAPFTIGDTASEIRNAFTS